VKHVEINLGLACNNSCLFCLAEGIKTFVPFEQVVVEAKSFARQGYDSLGFIGGEPTIYPRIADLVRQCSQMGFTSIQLISNGRRLRDESFALALIQAGITRFSISIHSHIEHVEDTLTGFVGGFRQKIEGIENLAALHGAGKLRDIVAVNMVVNKMNFRDLSSSLRFFTRMGIHEFRLLTMRPEGRATENMDDLAVKYSDFHDVLPGLILTARKHNLNMFLDPFPHCLFRDIPGVLDIVATDHIDIVIHSDRDFVRETFSWNQRRCAFNKTKGPRCAKCRFDCVCEGVWKGYADRFGFDEFVPVDEEQE